MFCVKQIELLLHARYAYIDIQVLISCIVHSMCVCVCVCVCVSTCSYIKTAYVILFSLPFSYTCHSKHMTMHSSSFLKHSYVLCISMYIYIYS